MTDADENNAGASLSTLGGWLRRRWYVVGLLAALVAVVVIGAVVLAGDDDGDDGRDREAANGPLPTPPPTVGGDVDEEGQELLALLERGNEQTYHATYEVSGDPDVVGSSLRIDVWRDDGKVRQDLHQETESATVESASFLLDGEAIACTRVDDGDWSCARQAPGDEFTAAGMFGTIARELEGADVVATDEEVAGRQARCFTLTGLSGEVSQCMSEDGVPLRRTGDGVELVLAELGDDVPDDTFTPPAEPVSGD